MVKDAVHAGSLGRVGLQQSLYESPSRGAEARRNVILVLLYLCVRLAQARRLKRRLAHQQCVSEYKYTNVCALSVNFLHKQGWAICSHEHLPSTFNNLLKQHVQSPNFHGKEVLYPPTQTIGR